MVASYVSSYHKTFIGFHFLSPSSFSDGRAEAPKIYFYQQTNQPLEYRSFYTYRNLLAIARIEMRYYMSYLITFLPFSLLRFRHPIIKL